MVPIVDNGRNMQRGISGIESVHVRRTGHPTSIDSQGSNHCISVETISTWYEVIAGGIEKIWDDIAAGIMKNRLWKRLP
jgi:hypothetical protein